MPLIGALWLCLRTPSAVEAQQKCQLALPCAGSYVLQVCTADNQPQACANITLGQSAAEWAELPWSAWPNPQLSLSKDEFKPGDTAGLLFQNSYDQATAFAVWG